MVSKDLGPGGSGGVREAQGGGGVGSGEKDWPAKQSNNDQIRPENMNWRIVFLLGLRCSLVFRGFGSTLFAIHFFIHLCFYFLVRGFGAKPQQRWHTAGDRKWQARWFSNDVDGLSWNGREMCHPKFVSLCFFVFWTRLDVNACPFAGWHPIRGLLIPLMPYLKHGRKAKNRSKFWHGKVVCSNWSLQLVWCIL